MAEENLVNSKELPILFNEPEVVKPVETDKKKTSRKRKRYDPVPSMTSKQLRDQLATKGYTGLTKLNKIELNMMLKKDAQTEKRKLTREKNKKKHEELVKKVETKMAEGVGIFENKHEKKIYEKLLKAKEKSVKDKSDIDSKDSSKYKSVEFKQNITEEDFKLFQKYMSEKNAEEKRAKKKHKKN